jgi:hypothetical protein
MPAGNSAQQSVLVAGDDADMRRELPKLRLSRRFSGTAADAARQVIVDHAA